MVKASDFLGGFMRVVYDEKNEPIGNECDCGTIHKWPLYVFAHFDEELCFTCPECNRQCTILSGDVYEN
jgi:hypothetical protein